MHRHMLCTAALDASVQIWRNIFVHSSVLTRSRSVSLKQKLYCFCMFWPQNLFRNFTFEIIDYFKCHSNGSSRPHLNQMLKFSLNCPTTERVLAKSLDLHVHLYTCFEIIQRYFFFRESFGSTIMCKNNDIMSNCYIVLLLKNDVCLFFPVIMVRRICRREWEPSPRL